MKSSDMLARIISKLCFLVSITEFTYLSSQFEALTLWKRVFENRSCNKYNSIELSG